MPITNEELAEIEAAARRGEMIGPTITKALVVEVREGERLAARVAELEAEAERGWAMARSYYKDREEAREAAENYFLAWEDSRIYWKDKVARLETEATLLRGTEGAGVAETGERPPGIDERGSKGYTEG